MRYFRAGRVVEKAFLDDYAFLILGLLDLYEATFDLRWLRQARTLAEQMIDLFADEAEGGFFTDRPGRASSSSLATSPAYDGVIPSGNSAAALGLLKLGTILMDDRFTEQAENVFRRFSGQIAGIADRVYRHAAGAGLPVGAHAGDRHRRSGGRSTIFDRGGPAPLPAECDASVPRDREARTMPWRR